MKQFAIAFAATAVVASLWFKLYATIQERDLARDQLHKFNSGEYRDWHYSKWSEPQSTVSGPNWGQWIQMRTNDETGAIEIRNCIRTNQ